MKYGPKGNPKFGLGYIFLIITIILVWVISSNTLFINNKLNTVVDKVIQHFVPKQQVSLTKFSDTDNYIKDAVVGLISPNQFPVVDIKVKQKNILVLNSDRENGGRSWVPASLSLNETAQSKDLKIKIRPKGDRQLHKDSFASMSLRVNMKGDNRLFGLEEFSVQDPIIRGYAWELLVAEILKSQGLLTLQSKVANFSFNGESRGLYVFEEVPSKITIERNSRKSGPIFGLDEDYGSELDSVLDVYDSKNWEDSNIYIHAKGNLLSQFAAVRSGGIFSENIFDLDEWAKYFALIDLFGTFHGAIPKSVKFYYNPVIGKFQPLLFDAHKGAGSFEQYIMGDLKMNPETIECEFTCQNRDFFNGFLGNEYFFNTYLTYLEKFSKKEFVKKIENVYKDKFYKIDQKFYASLSRSDGIFYRGFGLYFFKFSEIERRRELLIQKVEQLNEHKETFSYISYINDRELFLSSKNEVNVAEGTEVISIDNLVMEGSVWNFNKPAVLLLTGDTVLKGNSKDSQLNINGSVMLVQQGGTISLDNVNFIKPINIDVSGRQWSGAVNIINAKANLQDVLIKDSNAEDAINLISSSYEISNLMISGSKSDAIDFDFSNGTIGKISCHNIGNDCVDASESSISIITLVAENVEDKGVSSGENSSVKINTFDAKNVAVGLVSKDGSELVVDEFLVSSVPLEISAYNKKPEYSSPSISVKNVVSAESQLLLQALVSNNSKVEIPDVFNILIEESSTIESRMYGVEFGKATEK